MSNLLQALMQRDLNQGAGDPRFTDYAQAANRYDLNRGLGVGQIRPVQNAGPADSLIRVLGAYFAGKGMRGAERDMSGARQEIMDTRAKDLSNAMSAYRGDTDFEYDRFSEEEPLIKGLKNRGQGQNRTALAESLMGSQSPQFQNIGLNTLLSRPENTTDKKIQAFQQAKAMGLLGDDVSFADFIKLGTSSTNVNVGNEYNVPAGHMPNPNKGQVDPNTGATDTREVVPIPGSKTERDFDKPTATQSTAANYAGRMIQDMQDMDAILGGGFDPAQFTEHAADSLGTLGNYMKSPEGQQFRAAQEDWVRAKLRKESGAVIADEEMEREIRVYFPQPGDGPEVQFQKKLLRIQATNGMIKESDRAFDGDLLEMPKNPYRTKEPAGGLTPEEEAELEALEKLYGQ